MMSPLQGEDRRFNSCSAHSMENKKLIEFLSEIGKLKNIDRKGWVVSNVKNVESVADHNFRTILMTLVIGKNRDIDLFKAIKMAVIHDIAESKIGDLIEWNNYEITEEEKHKKEKKAMKKLTSLLDSEGKEYLDLWLEMEKCESKEAKFVKAMDKLEMVLQAYEYEKSEKDLNKWIKTFYDKESKKHLFDKELMDLFNYIVSLRKGQ